jgi:hypothetical protein
VGIEDNAAALERSASVPQKVNQLPFATVILHVYLYIYISISPREMKTCP